jgi:CheY-like chemotaxis protein
MAHILLAEDEALVAFLIEDVLRDAGHEVIVAANGREALALAGGARVDLLVTDLRMPEMDGFGLISALRSDRPGLPVVVMTGFPGGEGGRSLDGLAPDILVFMKPVDLDRLVSTVGSLLAPPPAQSSGSPT